MTVTITLDSETEAVVTRKARRLGLTPGDYLVRLAKNAGKPRKSSTLQQNVENQGEQPFLTPAQAVARWREQGIIGSYGDPEIDAPELARKLRHDAENRQWD